MDPLERELRDLLTSDRRELPASLVPLDRVHAGASRRRRRRAAVASAATAVAVLAVAGTAAGAGFLRDDKAPVADSTPTVSRSIVPAPVPTSTAPDTTVNAPSGPAWGGASVTSVTATSTRTFVVLGELGGHRRLHADRTACGWPRATTAAGPSPPCRSRTTPGRGGRAGPPTPPPACGSAAPRTAGSSAAACGPPTTAATAGRGVTTPGRVVRLEAAAGYGLGAGADAGDNAMHAVALAGRDRRLDQGAGRLRDRAGGPVGAGRPGRRGRRTGLRLVGRRHRRLRRSTRAPAPARLQRRAVGSWARSG